MALSREFALIEKIRSWLGRPSEKVDLGVGDDAAILVPPRGRCLATVDMLVEGVHFSLDYTGGEDLGHKALAVNLSDIAAMAGNPLYALVSLGLPAGGRIEDDFLEAFYRGMKALASRHSVDVVGGNLARSPGGLVVDVTLIGEATGTPACRRGARPGDVVAVSGSLGASAAGLACLKTGKREGHDEVVRAHLRPEPRLAEARALAATGGLHALIDVSDGFSSDLHHLAEASGVGVTVDEEKMPVNAATRRAAVALGKDPLRWALDGGEDYQLVAAVAPDTRLPAGFTAVGEVTPADAGVRLRRSDGATAALVAGGWDHFKRD